MPVRYRPADPEIYNRIRGFAGPQIRPQGPASAMPFGGPRLPEINQGAPIQGNPLLGGNFPTTSAPGTMSPYGNSMGQKVMGRPMPPTHAMGGEAMPRVPSGSSYSAGGMPSQEAPRQEYSGRFTEMLKNTANMTDDERSQYFSSQRDALMERLARYDFAKNRGLVLDASAQADYDNIVKMMSEINRYKAKMADIQRASDFGAWILPQPPMVGGTPIDEHGREILRMYENRRSIDSMM